MKVQFFEVFHYSTCPYTSGEPSTTFLLSLKVKGKFCILKALGPNKEIQPHTPDFVQIKIFLMSSDAPCQCTSNKP